MKKLLVIGFLIASCASAFAATLSGTGRTTVTTAGTAVQLSTTATPYSQVTLCAETDNTGIITVGDSGVVAALATRRGVPLNANDCYTVGFNSKSGDTLNNIWLDTTVNTDGVTYHWIAQQN